VANYDSNDVSEYAIDWKTGSLTNVGTIAAGTGPRSITIDAAGRFAYAANEISNDVSVYAIDATSGLLTPIGSVAAGSHPFSITTTSIAQ
jgi:6-phosphogluconolactonase (cycloisomerase 2 family)